MDNLSGGSIAAMVTGLVALIGAVGTFIAVYRKSRSESRERDAATAGSAAKARVQLEQNEHRFIVGQWKLLYEELHGNVKQLQANHLQCEVALVNVRTQLHELLEWKTSVERRGAK